MNLASAPVPLIHMESVFHVGTLDQNDRTSRESLEAFCLSVSIDPDEWANIARSGGAPTWRLDRPGTTWLDVLSLHDDQTREIVAWGVDAGFAEPATLYRAYFFDDEADSLSFMLMNSWEEAEYQIEDDPDGYIEEVQGHRLTRVAMDALERWWDDKDCMAGLVILWADRILAPDMPQLGGLWWSELYDPLSLSCPRGGVLPSRIAEFDVILADEDPAPDF